MWVRTLNELCGQAAMLACYVDKAACRRLAAPEYPESGCLVDHARTTYRKRLMRLLPFTQVLFDNRFFPKYYG